jgi:proline dehydrogenase
MRKIWQAVMINLARSASITRVMQSWSATSRLAKRYVAGTDSAAACDTALAMKERSIRASLFYMGEYLDRGCEARCTCVR